MPGRILAIDYGRVKMGLALSDPFRLTAQPLAVFSRTNRANDLRRLRNLCRQHEVRKIVVGYPLHLNGAESEMAKQAAGFAARLQKNLGLPVELTEERLTSWEAQQNRRSVNTAQGRGRSLDDLAAALILRDFLERNRAQDSLPLATEAC
jgi:putative Holliday junction resolvase